MLWTAHVKVSRPPPPPDRSGRAHSSACATYTCRVPTVCLNCGGAGFLHVPFPHQCPYCVRVPPPAPSVPLNPGSEWAHSRREQATARRELLAASNADMILAVLLTKMEWLSAGMYRWDGGDAQQLCSAWTRLVAAGYVEVPSHQLVPVRVTSVFGQRTTFARRAGRPAPAWQARCRSVEAWLDTDGEIWTEDGDREAVFPGAVPLSHGGIRHVAIPAGEPIRLTSRPSTPLRCLASGAFVTKYTSIGHPNEILNRLDAHHRSPL
jgi:hypothetical protein